MSTRATIVIKENDGDKAVHLVTLYHHSDGYPSWLGVELAKFALSGKLVNGIQGKDAFNGAGCFAAALIKAFKEGPGGLYVVQEGDTQEYDYTITVRSQFPKKQHLPDFTIACKGHQSTGPLEPKDFLVWAEKKD